MKKYSRITEKERCLIEQGIRSRKSIREIARMIDRPPKTVSVEIRRNGGRQCYYAEKAHFRRSISNKRGFSKIERNIDLKRYILEKLKEKWSPEKIAGRWRRDHPTDTTISIESIYQWIYAQKDGIYQYLRRKKKQRGKRPQRATINIEGRVSIDDRPLVINTRERFGDCEGDLVFQRGNQSQNFLTVVERKSRMIFIRKNDSKRSDLVAQSLQDIKEQAPFELRSMTLDNGKEFAKHHTLNIPTFFCNPGSPWQKGAIENVNGIIREYLDFRVDPETITQADLDKIAHQINNTPRKILNFLTPIEVIQQQIQGVHP
jgi:IS30 family transposase